MRQDIPPSVEKREYVRNMFNRIASRYDLMNRIITFGQDAYWRRQAVALLHPDDRERYLDLGAGTGDLSIEIKQFAPEALVIAVDLTMQMILYGREKTRGQNIQWLIADAQALPFPDKSFTGVISGYLLRNVTDVDNSLSELYRVTQQAGKLVALDTTPPDRNAFYPFIHIYLKWVIPLIGRLITGDFEAYTYLPESTRKHLPAELLAEKMSSIGFKTAKYKKLMFGTMSIHSAQK